LFQKKMHKEDVEMREEGRVSGHKLNITDELTDKIILMVTPSTILSVEMSRHRMICLLESHCNTLRNVTGIYWREFFVGIFTDKFYHQVNFIIVLFVFLFLLFPLRFSRYIPWEYSCRCLLTNLAMKSAVSKYHHNIPTKKFHQCLRWYLSTFW
jgi:hypothetical protein